MELDLLRDSLGKFSAHKPMGLDGMFSQVLRNLVEVVAKMFSIFFEVSWKTEVFEDWQKANVTLAFK